MGPKFCFALDGIVGKWKDFENDFWKDFRQPKLEGLRTVIIRKTSTLLIKILITYLHWKDFDTVHHGFWDYTVSNKFNKRCSKINYIDVKVQIQQERLFKNDEMKNMFSKVLVSFLSRGALLFFTML